MAGEESFIDTTQHTGQDTERSRVWQRWGAKHLDYRLFQKSGVLGKGGEEWRNVAEHTLVVNATAHWIAQGLRSAGHPVRIDLIDAASMLQDVTKRREKEQGVGQADRLESTIHQDALRAAGYSEKVIEYALYSGRVPEMFLADSDEQRKTVENLPLEKLVGAYADARVRNVEIVSLEDARDKNKLKIPKDAAVYDQWYSFYKLVEERLFSLIGRPPTDLTNESVFELVRAENDASSASE